MENVTPCMTDLQDNSEELPQGLKGSNLKMEVACLARDSAARTTVQCMIATAWAGSWGGTLCLSCLPACLHLCCLQVVKVVAFIVSQSSGVLPKGFLQGLCAHEAKNGSPVVDFQFTDLHARTCLAGEQY